MFSSFERFTYPRYIVNGENRNIEKTAALQIRFFSDDQLNSACVATFLMTLGAPRDSRRETYFLVTKDKMRLTIERDWPPGHGPLPTIRMQQDEQSEFHNLDPLGVSPGNQEPTRDFIAGLLQNEARAETSAGVSHLRSAQIAQAAYLSAIRGAVKK